MVETATRAAAKSKSICVATMLLGLVAVVMVSTVQQVSSFSHYSLTTTTQQSTRTPTAFSRIAGVSALHMAKNNQQKGFGKKPTTTEPKNKQQQPSSASAQEQADYSSSGGFESLLGAKPKNVNIDPNLPPEERTKQILKQQYGLKTYEDLQMTKAQEEQRKKFAELKKRADAGEDLDLFQLIPAPLLIIIDRFLKIGLALTTVTFVAAGGGITLEAWSVATNHPLSANIDQFIVQVIEPNFTYGLLVLLGFSISLGIFATAQLGSGGSQYSEK
jgi:hypothetical protein